MRDKLSAPLVYLETSMIIAYFQKEQGRWQDCKACVDDLRDGLCRGVTSALSIAEVAKPPNTDARKLPDSLYNEMVNFFKYDWLHIVMVDRRVSSIARDLVRQFNLKGADAVHLATAIYIKADYLFTYDKHLLRLAVHFNNQNIRPEIREPFGQFRLAI
ncbi:type II toxin-antitoxin system VapC family toxin [Thermaerobacter litoralis]